MKHCKLGCFSAAIGFVVSGVALAQAPAQDAAARGHALFAGSCAYCHGERGFATALLAKRVGAANAPLEARADLTPELLRHVVRHGIGGMPWYRRTELSDADLNAIIAYLTSPKANR